MNEMERGSISEYAMEGAVRRMSYGQFVAARFYPVEIVQFAPDGGKIVRSAPMPPVVMSREEVIARGRRRIVDGPVRSGKPKKERKCVICGGLLGRFQRKYCSDECTRVAHDRGLVKECAVCGEPLGVGQQKYCGWECRDAARGKRQRENPVYIPIDLPDSPCTVCGQMMRRHARNQHYCGPECREKGKREIQKAYRERNRPEPKVRICTICGGKIDGSGIKYCSTCAGAEAQRRSRERRRR